MRLRRNTPNRNSSGAARALTVQALHASKRARRELFVLVPLIIGVFIMDHNRHDWFSHKNQDVVRLAEALLIAFLGWRVARDFHRSAAPILFRRMDPATAGTVGFLVRLILLLVVGLTVLSVAGIDTGTLAVGGALFAVIFGLAAQQTLGNVFAGLVLIAAQPFRVGDRVRLQAGSVAGQLEGVVESHGLLYTTFLQGEESIM